MLNMVELVKELRARTHLGMNECKKALEEFQGDIEKALEALQKRGLKKIDDLVLPTEGVVRATIIQDHLLLNGHGFITEINCQTDFGARSEIFQEFVEQHVKDPNITTAMLAPHLNLVSNQLGEKVIIRRSEYITPSANTEMVVYNHLGGKIAVLLQATLASGYDKVIEVLGTLENIAMQIAATKPLAVDRASLSEDLVQKKTALYEDEVKFKPEQVKAKILAGKMNKWYSEVVLLEQEPVFLSDSTKETIQDQLNKFGPDVIKIEKFVRYERGETL